MYRRITRWFLLWFIVIINSPILLLLKPSLYIEGRSDHLVVQVMGPVVHPLVLMASIDSSGAPDETSSDQQSDNSSKEGVETVVDLLRRHDNGMSVDDCTSLISELFQLTNPCRLSAKNLLEGINLCQIIDPNFPAEESILEYRRDREKHPGTGGDTVNLLNADQSKGGAWSHYTYSRGH